MSRRVRAAIGLSILSMTIPTLTLVGQQPPNQSNVEDPPDTQVISIPMTPPQAALKMIELPDGFKATLFASEPDVHQPISVTTDARGRLWVAECYTYSDRSDNFNLNLKDRIVIFEDVDHDGVFDKRTVFWDQGQKLTSLEVGFGGVWVTAAPNLMFIPDRNGDDIPDGEPEILLDGFDGDVIRHNIVNGLRWGPDGWLYGRHGIQATSFVGSPGSTDSQRTPMNCAIWRYHPTFHKFEIVAQGGTNPWGFDYDEYGEMFMINTVIGHLFHVVPNARYRRMYGSHFNPYTYQVIEQTADHFHWDVGEPHTAVTQKSGMSDGTDLAGGGHAHTGLMIYNGGNWPEAFRNQLFTANFHGRRINSDSISREGNSYVAKHGPDYFKTDDPWFRGIELIYGPDGGVFLLDWSDIGECHEHDGIHRSSGRIFKLAYGDPKPPLHDDLSKLTDDQLIALFGNDNEWYSRTARRLLQERKWERQKTIGAALADSRRSTKPLDISPVIKIQWSLSKAYQDSADVKTKLRLMWAYYACSANIEGWLIDQTSDENEHIRAWAVRLLTDGIYPVSRTAAQRLQEMAKNDPSGLVRLYLASSLPRLDEAGAYRIALELVAHSEDASDRAQPSLIWFGIEPRITRHLDHAIEILNASKIPLIRQNIARRLTSEIGGHPEGVEAILTQLKTAPISHDEFISGERTLDTLKGMAQALQGWSKAPEPKNWDATVAMLSKNQKPAVDQLTQQLSVVFGDGRAINDLKSIANDGNQDSASRRQAIATLAQSSEGPKMFEFFKRHLNNKSLTTEIVTALANCPEPEVAEAILGRYRYMDPAGRVAAVNTLVARNGWAMRLLDAIGQGTIPANAISAAHARQIKNFENEKLTEQLIATWGQIRETSAERQIQMEELDQKLSDEVLEKSNRRSGQLIFTKTCANCHTLFGAGGRIGPDLTGSDRKNLNYLLENIIDPSASVAQDFRSSVIVLNDGRLVTGVIVHQDAQTIRVQTKDELKRIDRRSIDEMRQTKNSLMPDGLLDGLSEQEIVDLFGYLSK